MKEGIHPKYVECKVTCGCGSTFVTRCSVTTLSVEICSACHPFYTGKQKFVDAAGRVEKFQSRHAWSKEAMDEMLKKKSKRAPRKEKVSVGVPKTKKRKATDEEDSAGGKGASKPKGGGPKPGTSKADTSTTGKSTAGKSTAGKSKVGGAPKGDSPPAAAAAKTSGAS